MRRSIALLLTAALWIAGGYTAVLLAANTNKPLLAETSYVVLTAVIALAWGLSALALRRAGIDLPYRPR